jgi:deoxyribonuclease V
MNDAILEIPDLPSALRQLMARVPRGRVTTCGALAEALGNPVAARWIGHFLLHHEHGRDCHCYRVVRAEGVLGPYIEGGPKAKAARLAAEDVAVSGDAVDLARYAVGRLRSDRPLERLKRLQEEVVGRVKLTPRRRLPHLVGGVDVSYGKGEMATAAYTLVDTRCGALVWSSTTGRRVTFPYITSYLTFRELPILMELIDNVRRAGRLAPVVLVDGSGILHPRRAGIATHFGVAANWPTIGVTKKLLCGQVDIGGMKPLESRPVLHDDRLIGVALRPTSGSLRPIFLSPGHRVDVAFAEQVVRQTLVGHRLPEPLYWADRLSRLHARNCDN